MAKFTLLDPYVSVNGTDLSSHVRQVTLEISADLQDATTGDSGGFNEKLAGLKDWRATIEFAQDFDANMVDATLFPLIGQSTTLEIRPHQAARSATNPGYNGNAILESYPPLGGSIGDLVTASVTFQGNGAISRATA